MREDLGSRTFADAERWHGNNLPPPERHEIDDTDLVRDASGDHMTAAEIQADLDRQAALIRAAMEGTR